MATLRLPPSKKSAKSLLTTQLALLDTVTEFITVATHHILYLRRVYPPISFVSTRAYNYPVRQNRHPDVCKWIQDAVAAIRDQLEKSRVQTVSLCIFECENNEVLEKWSFDLRSFPHVVKKDWYVPYESVEDAELRKSVNTEDLEQSFRATFSRLDTVSGKMRPLPDGVGAPEYSFTMTIEIRDGQKMPLSRRQEKERRWVATEPDPFRDDPFEDIDEDELPEELRNGRKTAAPDGKTHAIRRLEAGELRMEMYVEESEAKTKLPSTFKTLKERSAEMSYGVGKQRLPNENEVYDEDEAFDPEEGYKLDEREIHRKPAGGAFTDYQRDRR